MSLPSSTTTISAPRLALLMDALDDEYQETVLRGVRQGCARSGASLLCVPGGTLEAAARGARNFIFELIGIDSADARIAISSSIGNVVGRDRLKEALARYQPLPTVSLGVTLDGIPSVTVDNAAGMREVTSHLVDQHSCRRIAYVSGPAGSVEAQTRLSAYQEVLREHQIEADPRLVVEGTFERSSGARAVCTLLDERRITLAGIDAFVAANDQMAFGVLDELDRRSVAVPGQVAVAGFDDVESARLMSPPLTTASQPSEAQGREGVSVALKLLAGADVASEQSLPTRLVVRRSCGCFGRERTLLLSGKSPVSSRSFHAALAERRGLILAEMARAAQGTFAGAGRGWDDSLLQTLVNDLRDQAGEALPKLVDDMMGRLLRSGSDGARFHDVLSVLRSSALECAANDPPSARRLEDVLHDACRVVGVAQMRSEARLRFQANDRTRALIQAASDLVTAADEESIARALANHLPGLGIARFALSLFTERGNYRSDCRPVLVVGGPRGSGPSQTFPSVQLAPDGFLDRSRGAEWLALPIVVGGEPFGIAVASLGQTEGMFYEQLLALIGAAFRVVSLSQELDTARTPPNA